MLKKGVKLWTEILKLSKNDVYIVSYDKLVFHRKTTKILDIKHIFYRAGKNGSRTTLVPITIITIYKNETCKNNFGWIYLIVVLRLDVNLRHSLIS